METRITIRNLIDFLKSQPEEVQDYGVIIRRFGSLKQSKMSYTVDKNVISTYIDEESQELCIMDKDATDWFDKNVTLDKQ